MSLLSNNLDTILECKDNIRAAIQNMGVDVGTAEFNRYADLISNIIAFPSGWNDERTAYNNGNIYKANEYAQVHKMSGLDNYWIGSYVIKNTDGTVYNEETIIFNGSLTLALAGGDGNNKNFIADVVVDKYKEEISLINPVYIGSDTRSDWGIQAGLISDDESAIAISYTWDSNRYYTIHKISADKTVTTITTTLKGSPYNNIRITSDKKYMYVFESSKMYIVNLNTAQYSSITNFYVYDMLVDNVCIVGTDSSMQTLRLVSFKDMVKYKEIELIYNKMGGLKFYSIDKQRLVYISYNNSTSNKDLKALNLNTLNIELSLDITTLLGDVYTSLEGDIYNTGNCLIEYSAGKIKVYHMSDLNQPFISNNVRVNGRLKQYGNMIVYFGLVNNWKWYTKYVDTEEDMPLILTDASVDGILNKYSSCIVRDDIDSGDVDGVVYVADAINEKLDTFIQEIVAISQTSYTRGYDDAVEEVIKVSEVV